MSISRKCGKCFLVEVPHRREQTLLQLIVYTRHILYRPVIYQAFYISLYNITPIVTEFTMALNPDDAEDAQNIENTWMCQA